MIDKIKSIKDPYLLEEISKLLNMEVNESEIMKLTPSQERSIAEGKSDIDANRTMQDKDANDEIDQWLN